MGLKIKESSSNNLDQYCLIVLFYGDSNFFTLTIEQAFSISAPKILLDSLHYKSHNDNKTDGLLCGMTDQKEAFSLISSLDYCQRFSPSIISDTPSAGFEPLQNLSSGFVE